MKCIERIEALRKHMEDKKIDAWIIPSSDPHQSEYVADRWKGRAWLSGFTGSAGTVVITKNSAGLWTDGRYFLQAESQLEGSGISLFKMGLPDVPTWTSWLSDQLAPGSVVSFDSKVVSVADVERLEQAFVVKKIEIRYVEDLLDLIWTDRPAIPAEKVAIHPEDLAGESRKQKFERVREEMAQKKVDLHVFASLDDIAWLFNIRGSDIAYNPVVICYAAMTQEDVILFINKEKMDSETQEMLAMDGITFKDYTEIESYLSTIQSGTVYLDPSRTSQNIKNAIPENTHIMTGQNITTLMKSKKNKVEVDGMRNAHIRDGVAMVKFFHWLENSIGKEKITELSAAEKLLSFRKEGEKFVGPSFNSISGFGEHGAIIHYSADAESDVELQHGLFLLDSGGQYLDGTTDITRTVVLGEPTEEQKRNFTLVLKGQVDLSMAKFMLNMATGTHLEAIARLPLWEHGLNFAHGTGHGVGAYLNVHEGPQSISPRWVDVKLQPGMICSNEPGFYKPGAYGIRIENLIVTREGETTDFGTFGYFETITYCPVDRKLIDPEVLGTKALKWLNNYHQEVYKKLSPSLNEEEKAWLKKATEEIKED